MTLREIGRMKSLRVEAQSVVNLFPGEDLIDDFFLDLDKVEKHLADAVVSVTTAWVQKEKEQ